MSMAIPIDVVLARRIAWLGLSLDRDDIGRMDDLRMRVEIGVVLQSRRESHLRRRPG